MAGTSVTGFTARIVSARARFVVLAGVLLATSIAVVSYRTADPSSAVGTPEINQIANTTDFNDSSSPEEMVMLGTTMIFRASRNDIGWELWSLDTTVPNAQPVLVKDINPDGDSYPAGLTVWNDKVVFRANDGALGNEIWVTDGTSAGTVMIKDINTGSGGSEPNSFRPAGVKLYFMANDGSSGHVMWVTNGTTAGTMALPGIATRTQGSNPGPLFASGSQKFYVAENPTVGREVWVSDGTDAGTRMVKDLNPGGGQGADYILGAIAGGVVFRGWQSTVGWELFFTDGTASGTVLLKDIVVGPGDSNVDLAKVAGGKLYFRGYDTPPGSPLRNGATGYELYVTNGTPAGTLRLTSATPDAPANDCWWCYAVNDIQALDNGVIAGFSTEIGQIWYRSNGTLAGTANLDPDPSDLIGASTPTVKDGRAFYSAGSFATGAEPWYTDGSPSGTVALGDLNPASQSSSASEFVVFGSPAKVIFRANDGIHGSELWVTDLTSAGTRMVKDINTTTQNSSNSDPQNVTAAGDKVYFRAYSPSTGWELWSSDGTEVGTVLRELSPGTTDSPIDQMRGLSNGELLFRYNNGVIGHEPWVTDGTASGTRSLGDFNPSGNTETRAAEKVGSTYFIVAHTGDYWSLWGIDGTQTTPTRLTGRCDNQGDPDVQDLRKVTNGVLMRLSDCQYGHRWWRSDGTVAGTARLVPADPQNPYNDPTITPIGDRYYYVRNDATYGEELWTTDGSVSGTRVLVDINTANLSSNPSVGVRIGSKYVFAANDGVHGEELWVSDGTQAGTLMLPEFNTTTENGMNSSPHNFVVAGGKVFFKAFSPTAGWELGATDGTVGGTHMFDMNPGRPDSYWDQINVVGDRLFFRKHYGSEGPEVWISDGTVDGTHLVKDMNPGGGGVEFNRAGYAGGRYFLKIQDYQTPGWTLWSTDGTSANTIRLTGPCANNSDANPENFLWSTNGVVFTLQDCVTGNRYWRTDGTVAGTVQLDPIESDSIAPIGVHQLNGKIVYTVADATGGSELWSTDGSPAGTVRLKDIATGTNSADATNVVVAGSNIYYVATDGIHGTELWVSDGTVAGSHMVKDATPSSRNSGNSQIAAIYAVGSKVLFRLNDGAHGWEAYSSDGTEAGTVRLTNHSNPDAFMDHINVVGNKVLFRFGYWGQLNLFVSDLSVSGTYEFDYAPEDGIFTQPVVAGGKIYTSVISSSLGYELFVTDGTSGGTTLMDVRTGSNSLSPSNFMVVGSGVVFQGYSNNNAQEWFYSDGTVGGTGTLDQERGDNLITGTPVIIGSKAVFSGVDTAHGREMWVWNGPGSTPNMLADTNSSNTDGMSGNYIGDGSKVYFTGTSGGSDWELFSTDGTSAGTGLLANINQSGSSNAIPVLTVNGHVITRALMGSGWTTRSVRVSDGQVVVISDGDWCGNETQITAGIAYIAVSDSVNGCEPYATDGTAAGTVALADIYPGGSASSPRFKAVSGSKVYFVAYSPTYGDELWVTDGSVAGTTRLEDWSAGTGNTAFSNFTPVGNGGLLFQACSCSQWAWAVTNGTAAGTYYLDLDFSDNIGVNDPTVLGSRVLYSASDIAVPTTRELWSWSAVTGEANPIDVNPWTGSAPTDFRVFGSSVIFTLDDGVHGREIMKSDGTSAGTTIVVDTDATPRGSSPAYIGTVGDTTYFSAWEPNHGRELWKTNGTTAGTVFVKDVRPGIQSTDFGVFGVLGTKLLLNIVDDTHGLEPWVTDGTSSGTRLLADVNATTNNSGYGYADQFSFASDGSRAYFRGYDGTERDLWTTDGTPQGTAKLVSINNGDDDYQAIMATGSKFFFRKYVSSNWYLYAADVSTSTVTQLHLVDGSRGSGEVYEPRMVGSRMVFRLYNFPTNNCSWQYWMSDGTAAGTVPLDNNPNDAQCVTEGAIIGNQFVFAADDGSHGREILVLDGTTGAVTTIDVNPTGSSNPDSVIVDGAGFRFRADDGVHGREWWVSDGTIAGTHLEGDVATRSAGSSPGSFTVMNGITYFKALSADYGVELWRTDGTVAGTSLVKDMQPGNVSSDVEIMGVMGSKLVVRSANMSDWQLWVSDGTAAGTFRLGDFNPSGSDDVGTVTTTQTKVYFRANNGTTQDMWVSDGTVVGTSIVDVKQGANDEWDSGLSFGSKLIFRAPTASNGRELFITDGTQQGTIALGDIETGSGDISFSNWSTVKLGNTILFEVYRRPNDGYHAWQWWRTDGTLAGTRPFDMNVTDTQEAENFSVVGTTLYFTDDDGTGRRSYKLDGLTGAVTSSASGSGSQVATLGNRALWLVDDGVHGSEPWKADSSGVFSLIADVNASGATSDAQNFVMMGGSVYFSATDGEHGRELWKSDGVNPPAMVADITTTETCCGGILDNLTVVGNRLFFAATTSATRKELWTSDGTAAGTRLVKDINTDNSWCWWCQPYPDSFNEVNGKLVFRAGINNDREVWVSDGTAAGTVQLADINPNGNSDADSFVKVGSRLYFRAYDSSNRRRLWSTDGTVAGTSMVKDVYPSGDMQIDTSNWMSVGSNAVLRFYEPNSGWQYWFTNGADSGTYLLDPYPTDGNWPDQYAVVGSTLFFNGPDLNNDRELWVIDSSGQRSRIGDLNPAGTANPGPFTVIGGVVYFPMDNDTYGREMWRSDGTVAGTSLWFDLNRVAATSVTESPAAAGSRVVFRHNSGNSWESYWELGVGDGTSVTRVDLNPNGQSNPQGLTTVGNYVVFSADNGTETQLWVSDGTVAGTRVLVDINASGNDSVGAPTSMDGKAFFRANDGTHGSELWVTDGTAAGTRRLTDINTSGDSDVDVLYASGNRIAVSATNGTTGRELYLSSDGTNFTSLGDNNPDGDHNPSNLVPLGAGFVYRGYDTVRGWEPWITDGTAQGTRILADLNPSGDSNPQSYTVLSSTKVLFTADDGTNGREAWITDGTVQGTLILDIQTGRQNGGSGDPVWITPFGGKAYMNVYTESRQRELWVTDGTLVGTRQSDINVGGGLLWNGLSPVGSNIAWAANDGANGIELWLSNGTSPGTSQVDINPSRLRDDSNSYPSGFTTLGSNTYFIARDAVNGNELWKTDGTSAGTQLVRDINAGTFGGDPDWFGMAGGQFVFRSRSAEQGNELWVSDGNLANSRLLKDIRPGVADGNPDDFVMSGGRLFFRADDGQHGREIWVTDGTEAGTRMIKDIYPANSDSGTDIDFPVGTGVIFRQVTSNYGWQHFFTNGTAAGTRMLDNDPATGSAPDLVTVLGDRVLYRLDDGVNGSELWSFNGNTGVRSMVLDINPGGGGAGFDTLWKAGDRVYFLANDGTHGRELWVTDGTTGGTHMVKDITPNGDILADSFYVVGTRMFFRASDGVSYRNLWVSDGTEAGTHEAKDIFPPGDDSIGEAVGGTNTFYFRSFDTTNGWELWRSDGTEAGTRMVMNLNPTGDAWMDQFYTVGDKLFFRADDTVHGRESWVSDGTEAGTFMLGDFNTTTNNDRNSDNDWVMVGAGKYLFHPYDGTSRQFWISDGTVAGTRKLASPNPCPNTEAQEIVPSGSRVYFRACDALRGWEPWVSDGTSDGTHIVADLNPGGDSYAGGFTSLPGGIVAFRANDGVHGNEMWLTDGTPSGTRLIADTNRLGADSNPDRMTVVGNKMFFTADDGLHGRELWVVDSSGTRMVADVNPGNGDASSLVAAGTAGVYYRYSDGVHGNELWYSDGTEAGTRMVKDLRPQSDGDLNGVSDVFAYVNGKVFFKVGTNAAGWELGVSDGTEAGTMMLELRDGGNGSEPDTPIVVGNKLFFRTWMDNKPGRRLMASDGTLAGTVDILPLDIGDPLLGEYVAFGSRLAFVANTSTGSRELWLSDGTIAGTNPASAINNVASAEVSTLKTAGSRVYFAATSPTIGRELFSTDGTQNGVVAIDLNPSGNSYPETIASNGNTYYFAANDGVHGRELFATTGTLSTTSMADISLAGGSKPYLGLFHNSVLYFAAHDGASGHEYWALTGGWTPPVVPNITRTALAPVAPVPVVRTVPATVPPAPTTAAPVSTTEAPFETVAPIVTTPVTLSPQTGTTPPTTVPVTTPTPSTGPSSETTTPRVLPNPTGATPNLSADEQDQLEVPRGQAMALVNGEEVPVVVNRVTGSGIVAYDNNRPAAVVSEIREQARELVSLFNSFLPAGRQPDVTVVDTPRGASIVGLLVDPGQPGVSIAVPAEFVIVITTPTGAMMMAGLNNSGNPSAVSTTGTLQVTRGGYIGVSTVGMPQSTVGQLLVMSTPRVLGGFTTSQNGTFSGQVRLPTDVPTGSHSLVVKADWFAASIGFLVTLPVAVSLPATGAESQNHVRYAILFVLIGVAVLVARRRRIGA